MHSQNKQLHKVSSLEGHENLALYTLQTVALLCFEQSFWSFVMLFCPSLRIAAERDVGFFPTLLLFFIHTSLSPNQLKAVARMTDHSQARIALEIAHVVSY